MSHEQMEADLAAAITSGYGHAENILLALAAHQKAGADYPTAVTTVWTHRQEKP